MAKRSAIPNLKLDNHAICIWENPETRRVLDSVSDFFVALDRSFNILFVNRALAEFNSRGEFGLLGKKPWELWPDLKDSIVEVSLSQALRTGLPVRFEFYYPRGNLWMDVNAYPSGPFFLLYFRDVTEQKRIEQEQAENESMFRSIVEALPYIAWSAGPDGIPQFFNKRWYEFSGQNSEDKYDPAQVVHPDDLPVVIAKRESVVARGETLEMDLRLRRHDGQYRWHHTRVEPLRDPLGNVVQHLGTSIDIHRERRIAESLRLAEATSRAIVNGMAAPVIVFDERGDVLAFNEAWNQLNSGVGGVGNVATALDQVFEFCDIWGAPIPTEDLPVSKAMQGEAADAVVRMRNKATGDEVVVSKSAVPIEVEGEKLVIVTAHDLTAQMRAQADLISLNAELDQRVQDRTGELKRANIELEAFTYHVAHDLRAPLRAIVGTSRMLQEDYSSLLPEDAQQLIVRQVNAGNKLGKLIDELLKLSRLAQEEVRLQTIDLSFLASEVASEHACENILVRFEVQPEMYIEGDPRLVRLLLSNLISNALRYSPKGGTVVVGQELTEGGAAFFVRDEGIGFEMQYCDKLFQPFERLVADSEFPGTGVGLANVARIVARHRGKVWANSEPGKGATFYFTLG